MLIGNDRGVVDLDGRLVLPSESGIADVIRSAAGWWAVDGEGGVWRSDDGLDWIRIAALRSHTLHCLLDFEHAEADLLIGASRATLFALFGDRVETDQSFASAEGRDSWYTPWGGPPDVRSMSASPDGRLYVNVHVGGILRRDAGRWTPTLDVHADVHEVLADSRHPGRILAATAKGLAVSLDGADSWSFETTGLPATYARAVAVLGEMVFLSVSNGSRGSNAAVYRTPFDAMSFEKCAGGLPEHFSTNVDTGCISTTNSEIFIGDEEGTVYRSSDAGQTWEVAIGGVGSVRVIAAA